MNHHTHARKSARTWARQMLKIGAVILDFETTDVKNADIVQIGALRTDGTVLMNTLVRPDLPISPGAQRVHGITMQTVADSPRFHQVYPALSRVLAGETVVAYNAPFEQRILGKSADGGGCHCRACENGPAPCANTPVSTVSPAHAATAGRAYLKPALSRRSRSSPPTTPSATAASPSRCSRPWLKRSDNKRLPVKRDSSRPIKSTVRYVGA
jgi:hypothetical protein